MAGTIPTTQLPQLERIQELQDAFNLLLFNTAKFFRDPAMGPHKRAKLKTKLIPQAQTRYENALSDLEFGIQQAKFLLENDLYTIRERNAPKLPEPTTMDQMAIPQLPDLTEDLVMVESNGLQEAVNGGPEPQAAQAAPTNATLPPSAPLAIPEPITATIKSEPDPTTSLADPLSTTDFSNTEDFNLDSFLGETGSANPDLTTSINNNPTDLSNDLNMDLEFSIIDNDDAGDANFLNSSFATGTGNAGVGLGVGNGTDQTGKEAELGSFLRGIENFADGPGDSSGLDLNGVGGNGVDAGGDDSMFEGLGDPGSGFVNDLYMDDGSFGGLGDGDADLMSGNGKIPNFDESWLD